MMVWQFFPPIKGFLTLSFADLGDPAEIMSRLKEDRRIRKKINLFGEA